MPWRRPEGHVREPEGHVRVRVVGPGRRAYRRTVNSGGRRRSLLPSRGSTPDATVHPESATCHDEPPAKPLSADHHRGIRRWRKRDGVAGHRVLSAHGGPGHHHREHRTAGHPALPGLLHHQPGLGGQRLHPHLRRSAAARRPDRRHPRQTARVHLRRAALRARLPARRPRPERGPTPGRTSPPGRRRRHRLPDRPLPGQYDLPRRPRAQPGLRGLRRGLGGRRRDRAARRMGCSWSG